MTTGTAFGYHSMVPGQSEIRESIERSILWFPSGGLGGHFFKSVNIDSTAVDAGATPTSLLRPGLVMAKLDASHQWVNYDPDGSGGQQNAAGILAEEVYMLDPNTAASADRQHRVLVAGGVIAGECINLDQQARAQLSRIIFDDDAYLNRTFPYRRVVAKAASYSVVAGDNGTLFTTAGAAGAVTFTLPAIANGLHFRFLNVVDQDMTIASAEGENIVAMHNATADSVAFSTASQKIGACVHVMSFYDGTTLKWIAMNESAGANTVTVGDS